MTTWMEHMTFHVQYKMHLTNMAACNDGLYHDGIAWINL